ncbi:VOC family protein [Dermatophilus congolensis]|uniref:Predicted enzyme related to lactoylglutathione lyase n=1 Tax=Dermatophilus congolensis TaxID=1863 RepID=A0A239V6W5_9MICO|nr:VOC family protein [Dermatophilus congolensis]MBO3130385.1 glyoxalase [Dermatophilus congolensis]MBO3130984.1 glyoxalase [Dermatophilus congolensis]MBO3134856.1 glyoxalase [Dermatophilus congolensis]MBO3137093.1 glyoxalase [Dermatophilus congolensis]MBO3139337.1 glyoxalase [Dermatophilus congolensis]
MLGFHVTIVPAPDLAASRAFYTALTGTDPVVTNDEYVGFQIENMHLGLDPHGTPSPKGITPYWSTENITNLLRVLADNGGTVLTTPFDVGGGRLIARVSDPAGNVIGITEDPEPPPA